MGTRAGRLLALLALLGLSTACEPPRPRVALVDHERWVITAAHEDPFDDRPAEATCDPEAVQPNVLGLEAVLDIETWRCGYVTVVQPSLHEIRAGDRIRVRLWHYTLTAQEPAEAHAAVRIGALLPFDVRIPIPTSGGLLLEDWIAPEDAPAGTPIYFHLHNHGANSFDLIEVSGGGEDEAEG